MAFLGSFTLILSLIWVSVEASEGPGARSNSCTFGYNNVYYVLGGTGMFTNGTIFQSIPYPFSNGDNNWSSLPDPPWQTMPAVNSYPAFSCAVNRNGKGFLFGNAIGFAVYDVTSATWSTIQLIFTPSVSMANLLNQKGLAAGVWPDGITISIFATGISMYMEFNGQNMTMDGAPMSGYPPYLHGFCMGVIETTPPMPVVCGGSDSGAYSDACWQLGLTTSAKIATLPFAQDGCAMVTNSTHFLVFPGFYAIFNNNTSIFTKDRALDLYDLVSKNWTYIPNYQANNVHLPLYDYMSATVMLGTGVVMMYGGQDINSGAYSSVVYQFNLQSNAWVTPFPNPQLGPSPYSDNDNSGGSNSGAIAGGTIGGLIAFAGIAWYIFRHRRQGLPFPTAEAPKDLEEAGSLKVLTPHKSEATPSSIVVVKEVSLPQPGLKNEPSLAPPPTPRNPHALPRKSPQARYPS